MCAQNGMRKQQTHLQWKHQHFHRMCRQYHGSLDSDQFGRCNSVLKIDIQLTRIDLQQIIKLTQYNRQKFGVRNVLQLSAHNALSFLK